MIRAEHFYSAKTDVEKRIGTKEEKELDKCRICNLRENCELMTDAKVRQKLDDPEMKVPYYIMADRENCILYSRFMHRTFKYDEKVEHVSDGIRDHYKIDIEGYSIKTKTNNLWEPCQPVYISAPTGKGKNTFIEDTIFSHVKELNRKNNVNKKVLIISNRKALCLQTKDRIKGKIFSKEFDPDFICPYPRFADVADVMLYQGMLKKQDYLEYKQQQDIIHSYAFVVCDEAHFFTSDSSFNPETEKILDAIVQTFKNAIRIYMTATPYDCLEYIERFERKKRYDNDINPEPGVCYHFKRNYGFLDTKYYADIDELKKLIVNSNEQWLIFIDDKQSCDEFKNELVKAGMEKDAVYAMSAESKENSTYQRMIVEEKFIGGIRVLISTSVIDNGVNFRGVKNVVLSDVSRVKCIQMLGRARLDDSESRITLYLKRFDAELIQKRLDDLEEQLDAYYLYDLAYIQPKAGSVEKMSFLRKYYDQLPRDWEHAKHWFGRDIKDPEKVFPNEIARSLVKKTKAVYESILTEMKADDEEENVPGQKYLEYQLSWFEKEYDEANDVTLVNTEEATESLLAFLESYVGKQMLEDEQETFRADFTEEHDKVFPREDKNKGRTYGLDKINKILEKRNLPYIVSNENREPKTGKTCWKVIRIEE